MKTKMFVALSVLLIVSLACGAFSKSQPVSNSQATELPQELQSTLPATDQPTGLPNLELETILGYSEDIGNGLNRLTILIDGKNASQDWYSYYMTTFGIGQACIWIEGTTLTTKEGYTYTPINDFQYICGPRQTWLTPPGSSFSWVGDDLNDTQNWWGWIMFDIPAKSTPQSLTFPYIAYDKDFNSSIGSVTTSILPVEGSVEITNPFDMKYGLTIVKPGEEINFGTLAKLKFQVGTDQPDGMRMVTLTLTSLDEAYPIGFDSQTYTYLVAQNADQCCYTGIYEWEWQDPLIADQGNIVGPLQSADRQKAVPVYSGDMWMVGHVIIRENMDNGRSETVDFVLKLP